MQARRSTDQNFKDPKMKQSRSRSILVAFSSRISISWWKLAHINVQDYIKISSRYKRIYIFQNTKLFLDLDIDNLIFSTTDVFKLVCFIWIMCLIL